VGIRGAMETRTEKTRQGDREAVEFEVVPDEVDGWDVIKRGESQSLSNHPTREEAEEAARLRGSREQAEQVEVEVHEDEVHGIDDDTSGVRVAFFSLGGLLVAIGLLIAVIALIGALTGFGS
jgi:Uncharacterized protein conserved in bacteria (DUF2188)